MTNISATASSATFWKDLGTSLDIPKGIRKDLADGKFLLWKGEWATQVAYPPGWWYFGSGDYGEKSPTVVHVNEVNALLGKKIKELRADSKEAIVGMSVAEGLKTREVFVGVLKQLKVAAANFVKAGHTASAEALSAKRKNMKRLLTSVPFSKGEDFLQELPRLLQQAANDEDKMKAICAELVAHENCREDFWDRAGPILFARLDTPLPGAQLLPLVNLFVPTVEELLRIGKTWSKSLQEREEDPWCNTDFYEAGTYFALWLGSHESLAREIGRHFATLPSQELQCWRPLWQVLRDLKKMEDSKLHKTLSQGAEAFCNGYIERAKVLYVADPEYRRRVFLETCSFPPSEHAKLVEGLKNSFTQLADSMRVLHYVPHRPPETIVADVCTACDAIGTAWGRLEGVLVEKDHTGASGVEIVVKAERETFTPVVEMVNRRKQLQKAIADLAQLQKQVHQKYPQYSLDDRLLKQRELLSQWQGHRLLTRQELIDGFKYLENNLGNLDMRAFWTEFDLHAAQGEEDKLYGEIKAIIVEQKINTECAGLVERLDPHLTARDLYTMALNRFKGDFIVSTFWKQLFAWLDSNGERRQGFFKLFSEMTSPEISQWHNFWGKVNHSWAANYSSSPAAWQSICNQFNEVYLARVRALSAHTATDLQPLAEELSAFTAEELKPLIARLSEEQLAHIHPALLEGALGECSLSRLVKIMNESYWDLTAFLKDEPEHLAKRHFYKTVMMLLAARVEAKKDALSSEEVTALQHLFKWLDCPLDGGEKRKEFLLAEALKIHKIVGGKFPFSSESIAKLEQSISTEMVT